MAYHVRVLEVQKVSPLSYIGPVFLQGGKTCKATLFLKVFVPQLVKVRGGGISFRVALDRWVCECESMRMVGERL